MGSKPQFPTNMFAGRPAAKVKPLSQSDGEDLIINYIIEEMRPLSCVEKPAFKNLISGLSLNHINIPCRRTLTKRIDARKTKMIFDIKSVLDKQNFVCTTADIWSSHNKSYMGITVHYIDPTKLERHCLALACRRFKFSHDYLNIARCLNSIHSDFNLTDGKVTHTVTDNASNFGKAFRCFREEISEVPVLGLQHESDTDSENEQDDDDLIVSENILGEDNLQIDTSQALIEDIELPPQMRCASHTLSLLATTDAKKALSDNTYCKAHQTAFKKLNALWVKVSRSTKSSDEVGLILDTKFTIPIITRWNSTYDAVKKVVHIGKNKVNEVCAKLQIGKFSSADFSFLEEYILVMEPIATVLDVLQGEKNCYLGLVLPSLHLMKSKLSKLTHLTYCHSLKVVLLSNLERRFTHIFHIHTSQSKPYILATISHPKFKLNWAWINEEDTRMCKKLFLTECETIRTDNGNSNDTENEGDSSSQSECEDFFSSVLKDKAQIRTSGIATSNVSLAFAYLDSNKTDLSMLHAFPVVKQMFLKYNTTVPSSAPVERMFSSGNLILVPRRCNLGDHMFETLLLLKCNKDV